MTILDVEISRARQTLAELEKRRTSLCRFEYLESGLLSPIGRLPSDILQHIFILASKQLGVIISNHFLDAFPRVAAQVCSYWRFVAHSCPSLWTDVKFKLSSAVSKYNPNYGNILQDFLTFSIPMPMSLHFGKFSTPTAFGDNTRVQLLTQCAPRWKHMTITECSLTEAVFSSIPKDVTFDHLETLTIMNLSNAVSIGVAPKLRHLTVTGDHNADPNAGFAIESAPCLEQLIVRSLYRPSTSLTGLDWSNIRRFEASGIGYQHEELVTILKRMPNLISLSLLFFGPTGSNSTVTMPHLKELTTGDFQFSDTNIFNNNVTAPRLKILDIEWRIDFSSLPSFVDRSQCDIEEIRLKGMWINVASDIPALASVKTLSWHSPSRILDCFTQLTYGNTSANDTFTGLENLHIADLDCLRDDWPITQYIDMLKSRLRPQHTHDSSRTYLKSLQIHIISHFAEIVAPLEAFVNSGLVKSSGIRILISNGSTLHLSTSA